MNYQKKARTIATSMFGMLLGLILLLSNCHSSDTDHDQSVAQWIGPEKVEFNQYAAQLENCNWIWSAPERFNPAVAAREVPAYFRKTISMDKTIKNARIILTADNYFKLFVNGEMIGENGEWKEVNAYDITHSLQTGENVIAIEAQNLPVYHTNLRSPGNSQAGLIASMDVVYQDDEKKTFTTDSSWKVSKMADTDWQKPEFNDSQWSQAFDTERQGLNTWDGPDFYANSWYCFRKNFNLEESEGNALAQIAVDSKYWLYINGELVIFEGGLKRGPNPNDTYVDEVDLSEFLIPGENTLAVLVWHWGRESFSHKNSGLPAFYFDLDLGKTKVVSDASWKVKKHPAYGFTSAPHPNYRLAEYNIHYDARQGNEEWIAPEFDDSGWESATEYGAAPVAPWNQLVERPIPQWFNTGLQDYERIETIPGNNVDTLIGYLPVNAHITPYLKIKSDAGQLIDIRMDNYVGGSEINLRSEYITREGEQEFEALAWINGHQVKYAIPKGVEVLQLKYRETGFDVPVSGSFTSNDEFYNQLWQKSLRTLQVCMRDNYFDCPDRERAQWWGDAVIEIGQTFYALDRISDSLSVKAIRELLDWRKPDGRLFSPVPGAGWDAELPGQMLMSVGRYGFWNYYMHTGDTAIMEYAYPAVKKYLNLWQMDDRGLVIHRTGDWDWGDWGSNKDRPLLDNCYYTLALQSAAEMAELTGNTNDLPFYQDRINSIKSGVNQYFWNGKEYRSPDYQGETDDRGNGLVVVAGIADQDKYEAIKQVLKRQFYASPYTEKYVLESLFLMNYPQVAMDRMKSRFEVMVAGPSTTLYEGWGIGSQGYGGGTINHSWSGGPLILLSQYVAGVAPIDPAYTRFKVKPLLVDLKDIQAKVPSPQGEIKVEILNQENSFSLNIAVPETSSCNAGVPVLPGKTIDKIYVNDNLIYANGRNQADWDLEAGSIHYQMELEPGEWQIKASYL